MALNQHAERRRLLTLSFERPLSRKERTRLRNMRHSLGMAEYRRMTPNFKRMERQIKASRRDGLQGWPNRTEPR